MVQGQGAKVIKIEALENKGWNDAFSVA